MRITEIESPAFSKLKSEIELHPRLCGSYIIDFVATRGIPPKADDADSFLDTILQYFDDQEWPPPTERPIDQSWLDYEVDESAAREHVVPALVGGSDIGHTRETMSTDDALEMWSRFLALFGDQPRFFIGMGLGDSQFVFQYGVVVVDHAHAGILWIVEGD